MLGEFAKYAFFGLTRKNPAFKRSVLKYVSIKNRIMTQSGQKSRVCVNQPDRLSPPVTELLLNFSCLALLPLGHGIFRPPATFGTPVRRAARRGRLWGSAPSSAPLASPTPEHPLRGAFYFRSVARARVLCCGSFLPSLRSLR